MKMIDALKKMLELAGQNLLDPDDAKTNGLEDEACEQTKAHAMIEEIVDAVESGETGKLGAFLYWVNDR